MFFIKCLWILILLIFPKHNKYGFISEYFALKWYIFVALMNKNCCLHSNEDFNKIVFPILRNKQNILVLLLLLYHLILVLDLCQGLSYLFFFINMNWWLFSIPKTTLFPETKFWGVKCNQESNPIQEYLSGSAILVNLTAPNIQSFRVNSNFMSLTIFLIQRQELNLLHCSE